MTIQEWITTVLMVFLLGISIGARIEYEKYHPNNPWFYDWTHTQEECNRSNR
jgi:hypothetical protein